MREMFHQAQEDAYQTLIKDGGGLCWMKRGEGKTRVGLVAAAKIGAGQPIILFVGRREAFYDVKEEFATLQKEYGQLPHWHIAEFETVPFRQSVWKPTVVLMSWGRWLNPITWDILDYWQRKNLIGCMVLDEGWLYKNPKSRTHKAAVAYGDSLSTILLSGSIMPAKDLVDIYGQTSVIGRRDSLAPNLTTFRTTYQMGIQGGFSGILPSWYPKPGAKKQIIDRITPFTAIHFPRVGDRKILTDYKKVEPTDEQRDYFKQLKEYAEIDGITTTTSAAVVVIRAQQISDGWIRRDEDKKILHIPSTKIEMLEGMCQDIINDRERVVVWCAFREDLQRCKPILEKIAPVVLMQGKEKFDIDRWKKSGPKISLATMASGNSVNHFGQVRYAIYFSQDWKWFNLDQSTGRHDRKNSEHQEIHRTFLHTVGSMDSKIHYVVQSSARTEESFINKLDVAKWVKGK